MSGISLLARKLHPWPLAAVLLAGLPLGCGGGAQEPTATGGAVVPEAVSDADKNMEDFMKTQGKSQ